MKFIPWFLSILAFLYTGCGVTQPVRAIPRDETRLNASLGGPVIPLGDAAVVVPYLNLGVQHGVTDDLTVFGNAHVTALLFKDAGLDAGTTVRVREQQEWLPEINAKGQIYAWYLMRSGRVRVLPLATVTAGYSTGDRSYLYIGADNAFQFTSSRHYFIAPLAGYSFGISKAMTMQVETKWLAPNIDTRHGIFEGATSIDGRGNIGIYFGLELSLK